MSRLFLASLSFLGFLPLWIVMLFRDALSICRHGSLNTGVEWYGVCILPLLCFVSPIVFFIGLKQIQRKSPEFICLERIKERKTLSSDVLLTYVLPLFAFDVTTWQGMVELCVFLCILFILFQKNRAFFGNVFLELLGYRFYECETGNDQFLMVLCKRSLSGDSGQKVRLVPFTNQLWMVVGNEE